MRSLSPVSASCEAKLQAGLPRHLRALFQRLVDLGPHAWFLGLFSIGLVLLLGPIMLRDDDPLSDAWTYAYLPAARQMIAGEALGRAYAYPPAMAFLAIPFALLPEPLARVGWYFLNAGLLLVAVRLAWRLAGGPITREMRARDWLVLALAALLAGRYVVSPLENRQTDLVIACLLLGGLWQLRRGGETAGAVLLGAGAAMKCTPLLFVPYLAIRGRIRAAAIVLAAAGALNVAPHFFFPRNSGQPYLLEWVHAHLRPMGNSAVGEWQSDILLNQSLSGLANRLSRFGLQWSYADPPVARSLSPEEVDLTKRIVLSSSAILLMIVLALMSRSPNPWKSGTGRGRQEDVDQRASLEAGAVFCLMLLVSPMTSKAHYAILILPILALSRRMVVERQWWLWLALPALVLFGPASAKGLVGREWGQTLLVWGTPTLFAALVLLLSIAALALPPRGESLATAPKALSDAPVAKAA